MPKNTTMGDSSKSDVWIGFDLGGTKMMAIVFDSAFNAVLRKRRKTKGHEGVQSGVARILETISEALAEAGVERGRLRGIGLGSAGPLDLDEGIILDAPNLGWKDVKMKATLEKEFGCPAAVLNDVDAGVYGEYRFGAARSSRCALGVFPGDGDWRRLCLRRENHSRQNQLMHGNRPHPGHSGWTALRMWLAGLPRGGGEPFGDLRSGGSGCLSRTGTPPP